MRLDRLLDGQGENINEVRPWADLDVGSCLCGPCRLFPDPILSSKLEESKTQKRWNIKGKYV
jgi:hypothetical protein